MFFRYQKEKKKDKKLKNKLKQIKSYMRINPEFEVAYSELKEEYRKKANPMCDSLELTLEGKPMYYQGELIYTRLADDYLLIGCDDFKMIIYELKEYNTEWLEHITNPEWLEQLNKELEGE